MSQETPSPENRYPLVLPDMRDWPIYQMARERDALIEDVIGRSHEGLLKRLQGGNGLLRNIAEVYYQERARMHDNPWKVDPKDDPAFWKRVRNRLQHLAQPGNEDPKAAEELLREIIGRYTREVAGDFKPGTYKFARSFIQFGFSRVFNAAQQGLFRSLRKQRLQLQEKMQIIGEVDKLRQLTKMGTVILVPTHFSNLDSIVIGWAIETLGLPAFTYGAGINLFGHPVLAYFMSRLGAFRVDRRKKNQVYLDVLKRYSEEVLLRGGHMLFFPGGTRSRSGSLESRFKLGLLGTAIETQQRLLSPKEGEEARKIFIVPLVISYHSVLEARGLIDEFLRQEGKERFILLQDDFGSLRKNISFAWKFFKSSSEMVFSFGEPLDLFGNDIDAEGHSVDKYGRRLDLKDYFSSQGRENTDNQRSQEYTRLLGQRILERFKRENVVFSSHLVAFAAWHVLLRKYNGDLYSLLAVQEEDLYIGRDEMLQTVDRLHVRLRELERAKQLRMAEHLHTDIRAIIEHGLKNLGVYHLASPLLRGSKGEILTQDLRLLYFYSNRLKGYDLEKYV